jgi:hypothetical protein
MNPDSEPYSYSDDFDETVHCMHKYKTIMHDSKPHSLHKPPRYTLSQKASIGQAPIKSQAILHSHHHFDIDDEPPPKHNPLAPYNTYEEMIQQRPTHSYNSIAQAQQEQHDFQIQVQSQERAFRRRQLSDQIDEYRIQLSNLHEDRQNILTQIQHHQRQINALNDNLQRNIIPDINSITQTISTLEQELRNT